MDISTFSAHRTTLAARGGDIAYAEFGNGPDTALFIHGLGLNGAEWRHVIAELSGTTRCIAVDLPGHGGTPPRADLSVTAMAELVRELHDGLGLGPVDLVGNDTGGAVAQVFAASYPDALRTLTLTNCDTDGNFPPPAFAPVIELARQGQLAGPLVDLAGDPAACRTSALAAGFEHPESIPDEDWRDYLSPVAGTADRARAFERLLASLDPADLSKVQDALRTVDVPALIVWGTGDEAFGVEWARRLRETLPGARDVIEVPDAKVFFPAERPGALIPRLREFWGR